jgi:hypothetical protein
VPVLLFPSWAGGGDTDGFGDRHGRLDMQMPWAGSSRMLVIMSYKYEINTQLTDD